MRLNYGQENEIRSIVCTDVEAFMDEIVAYIIRIKSPEDIFPKEDMEQWAENNGYVKEAEDTEGE